MFNVALCAILRGFNLNYKSVQNSYLVRHSHSIKHYKKIKSYRKKSNKSHQAKAKKFFCVKKAVSSKNKIATISSCRKSSMYLHSIASFNNTTLGCRITSADSNLLFIIWIANCRVISFSPKLKIFMVLLKTKCKAVSCMKKSMSTL